MSRMVFASVLCQALFLRVAELSKSWRDFRICFDLKLYARMLRPVGGLSCMFKPQSTAAMCTSIVRSHPSVKSGVFVVDSTSLSVSLLISLLASFSKHTGNPASSVD